MKKLAAMLMAIMMLLGSVAALADSTAIEPAFVTVTGGDIMGYLDDGVYTFAGIPYGKTAARFASPEPATWEGVKNCMVAGAVCPQSLTLSSTASVNSHQFMTPAGNDLIGNEADCLNLNVWTDSLDAAAKKPVFVFFHGGGSTTGSSWELTYYTGEYFAGLTDVVFVSVNMRLNVLGFMNLSAYGGEEWANSGNQILEDMVLSLEWVRDNIASFGGDPENVTIMGQSGGGGKVSALCCSPAAEGLFDRCVFMSSSWSTSYNDNAAQSAKLVEYLGLTEEDDIIGTLQNMPYEELLAAANACKFSATYDIGSELYPTPFYNAETGEVNQYAAQRTYMLGHAYSEFSSNAEKFASSSAVDQTYMKAFMTEEEAEAKMTAKYGERTETVKELYAKAYPQHDVVDVLWLNNRSVGSIEQMVGAGIEIYNYVVAYEMPYLGGVAMHHTGDMPFWFYSIDTVQYQIQGDEECAHKVSAEMANALANFCATGNPCTDALEWKPCNADGQYTMVFDRVSELKDLYFDAELIQTIKNK